MNCLSWHIWKFDASCQFFDTLLTFQEYPPGEEDRSLQKEPLKTVKDGKRVYYDSIKVYGDNFIALITVDNPRVSLDSISPYGWC